MLLHFPLPDHSAFLPGLWQPYCPSGDREGKAGIQEKPENNRSGNPYGALCRHIGRGVATMTTTAIDKNDFVHQCPECDEEAFSWNQEKGVWSCSACGQDFYDQNIAFCEICGQPAQVIDAKIYQPSEPGDYNPFVCSCCKEEQWTAITAHRESMLWMDNQR